MENLRCAIFQYDVAWKSPETNIEKIESLLKSGVNAHLLVLPEAFNTGFSMESELVSEPLDGYSLSWIKRLSRLYQIAICGSLFIKDGNRFYNRFFFIHPDGNLQQYDKRHLFTIGEEEKHYCAGSKQVLIEYRGWRIFPSICYDLRFPVWARNTMGYDLFLNVANWSADRKEVWKTLLKARGIENQCYAIGCNRIGKDGLNESYGGASAAFGPKGTELALAGENEECLIVELNYEDQKHFRTKFDVLKDRDNFSFE